MDEVIPLIKPQGITPLEAITELKKLYPKYKNLPMSFAGRLDPMAEGLLLILVGNMNKERQRFEKLDKVYDFEILLGIATDTYDCLGLIEKLTPTIDISLETITSTLSTLVGRYQQPFPPYSSKAINGKPLYYWAREGKLAEITIPTKDITVYSLEVLSVSSVDSDLLLQRVTRSLQDISGDFRQEAIKQNWCQSLTNDKASSFPLLSCRAKVTSGTYIRGLANTLGERLGCGALAYHIKRTQIGEYTLSDALSLKGSSNQR